MCQVQKEIVGRGEDINDRKESRKLYSARIGEGIKDIICIELNTRGNGIEQLFAEIKTGPFRSFLPVSHFV